jgi:tripartite-type tricarboxylate transporter receptor subunit TctC
MGALLGQTVVVENRSGASGTIAAGVVAQAPADGYTFLFATLTHATNLHLFRGLPFDYATAFAPVTQVATFPQLLAVKKDFPAASFQEFMELARRRPEPITYGTPGNATAQHLAGELLRLRTGIRLEHVPYRGGADAARDLAAGMIESSFMTTSSALPALAAGARPIAAVTPARIPAYPGMPTIAESGVPGYALSDWCGIFAPAATPTEILQRVQAACAASLKAPEVVQRLRELSTEPAGTTVEEFRAFVAAESSRLGQLIRDARISLS